MSVEFAFSGRGSLEGSCSFCNRDEGTSDRGESKFVPGWMRSHVNTPVIRRSERKSAPVAVVKRMGDFREVRLSSHSVGGKPYAEGVRW